MKLTGYNQAPLSTCAQQDGLPPENTSGKFYDITTEQFVVPSVGKEVYLHLANAHLWHTNIWIVINLINNKYAIFKITEIGNTRIKILNGLDKTGDNPVIGNPVPGTVIPKGSTFYTVIPQGVDNEFSTRVINVLNTTGVDAVIQLLAESNQIAFTNTPVVSDADGDVHLFGGTRPDCPCESGASVRSVFRKILNIITGQSGNTLCFPNVVVTSSEQVAEKPVKRMAVFDENGCLKKWISISDINSCSPLSALPIDTQFQTLIGCKDGVMTKLLPRKKYALGVRPVNPSLPDGDQSWQIVPAGLQFYPLDAPVTIKTSTGASSNEIPSYPGDGCWALLKVEWDDPGDSGFVSLTVDGEKVLVDRLYSYAIRVHRVIGPVKLLSKSPTIDFEHSTTGSGVAIKIMGYYYYP